MLSAIRSNRTFPSIFIILLICIAAVTILYKEFFLFSTVIWSMNKAIRLEDLTPNIKNWVHEYDGIETYCLYILIFAGIFLSLFILCVYRILLAESQNFIFKISYYILCLFLLFYACIFFINTGFYPPVSCPILSAWTLIIAIVVPVLLYFLFIAAGRFNKISAWTAAIILIPACFFATTPMYLADYSYVFAPALRIINHFKISEIYFQYDLLLSLLAVLWMKTGFDLNYFQIMGQFSLYVFLLASFFFSKRLFIKKELSFYLLAAMLLIKIFALMHDPVLYFQVTPLRLDWWILLVILAYEKGLYSKWTGVVLGFLIIFHRTFGIIYTLGYLETVFILLILDSMKSIPRACALKASLKTHLRYNISNLGFIALAWIISTLMFGPSLESASNYQSIGIGFIKISETSFYWYIAVIICIASIYLFNLREKLPDRYFTTGSFIILLAIGNSIYFFGRSHENNIINIAGALVFVLFMLFDLLAFKYRNNSFKGMPAILLPNIFIVLLLIFYSERISAVSVKKFENIKKLQFVCPMPNYPFDIQPVRELTDACQKVYFVGEYDFYYYYYGGYVPQGRFLPYNAWIFKKDVVNFLQNLLDSGYCIVFMDENNNAVLADLKYNKLVEKGGFKVVRN